MNQEQVIILLSGNAPTEPDDEAKKDWNIKFSEFYPMPEYDFGKVLGAIFAKINACRAAIDASKKKDSIYNYIGYCPEIDDREIERMSHDIYPDYSAWKAWRKEKFEEFKNTNGL